MSSGMNPVSGLVAALHCHSLSKPSVPGVSKLVQLQHVLLHLQQIIDLCGDYLFDYVQQIIGQTQIKINYVALKWVSTKSNSRRQRHINFINSMSDLPRWIFWKFKSLGNIFKVFVIQANKMDLIIKCYHY
eukprot:scaffold9553_cov50-Attheya_sp.AAC.1